MNAGAPFESDPTQRKKAVHVKVSDPSSRTSFFRFKEVFLDLTISQETDSLLHVHLFCFMSIASISFAVEPGREI